MDRRTLLKSLGTAAGGIAFVGTMPSGKGQLSDSQTNIRKTYSVCGEEDAMLTTRYEDGVVRVAGKMVAPSPCHEIQVSTESTDSELYVDLSAVRPDRNQYCSMCVANIGFKGSIDAEEYSTVNVQVNGFDPIGESVDSGTGGGEETSPSLFTDTNVMTFRNHCDGESNGWLNTTQSGDTVWFYGTMKTSTPCYEAGVTDYSVSDGQGQMSIDPVQSRKPFCRDCVGQITFYGQATLNSDVDVDDVMVKMGGLQPKMELVSIE